MKKVFYTGKEFIIKGCVSQVFYDADCLHFPETMKDDDAVYSLYGGKFTALEREIVLLREKQRNLEQAYERWIKENRGSE